MSRYDTDVIMTYHIYMYVYMIKPSVGPRGNKQSMSKRVRVFDFFFNPVTIPHFKYSDYKGNSAFLKSKHIELSIFLGNYTCKIRYCYHRQSFDLVMSNKI